MGSKYTRQQVIDERKCGLKYLDKAVAKVGMQAILDETVRIAKQFPDTWGRGWRNVDWAFGNAWRTVIDYSGAANVNLDEALTPEQLQWLADQLGHDIKAYTSCWDRRPPGKEIKKQAPKPESTLSTKDLKKFLETTFQSNLEDPNSPLSTTIDADGHLNSKELATEKTRWHKAASWGRDYKRKDADGNVVRKFWCGIYDAVVTTDPTDTRVLNVAVEVGPAWEPRSLSTKLILPDG